MKPMAKKSDRFLQLGMKNELKNKVVAKTLHSAARKSSTMSAI